MCHAVCPAIHPSIRPFHAMSCMRALIFKGPGQVPSASIDLSVCPGREKLGTGLNQLANHLSLVLARLWIEAHSRRAHMFIMSPPASVSP